MQANTDSSEKIIAASVGFEFFCPNTCKVYAAPEDMIPAYKIEIPADIMLVTDTF